MSRRVLMGLSIGLLVVGVGVAIRFNIDALLELLVDRSVAASVEMQQVSSTRFEVTFCGTGSPQYNPDRAQPCLGVVAGGHLFLFDAGQGAAQQLNATGLPFLKLHTVFLTHLHSDHMSGLGDVLHNGWLTGRQDLVQVVGPPGTQRLLSGVQLSFRDDVNERQRVLGSEYIDTNGALGDAREILVVGEGARTVLDQDGVVIDAFRVVHPKWPAAYGYRVSFGGKVVVISGDTAYTSAIGRHAQRADLLIHEVVNVKMMEMAAGAIAKHGGAIAPERLALITAAHTPTDQVAQAAVDAGAKTLVLTHLIPPIPANSLVESAFIEGMDEIYGGEIVVARDGMRITLID